MASAEKNRATSVALNAEVRRSKARLMEEIPKLRKLAQKKVRFLLLPVNALYFYVLVSSCVINHWNL